MSRKVQQRRTKIVRCELFLHLCKLINNFESNEVSKFKGLTKEDIIYTLSTYIASLTRQKD